MATVLVTGGAGFIGSHVVDTLIAAGHRVVVVDNLCTGRRENLNPQAEFHLLDIRAPEAKALIASLRPEVICHLAAQVSVRLSVADPVEDASINILGTLNILEGAVQAKVAKVIFASTGGAIYGEQDYFPADEQHPLRPVSPYGVAKLAVEKYLEYYHHEYGLSYIALRYSNVYGPRQDPYGEAGVVAIFTQRLLAGEPAVINGDGTQTRDFVYVGDVARANLAALSCPYCGPLNIGTGLETDINRLFQLIRQLTQSQQEDLHGPAKPGEQKRSVISPRLAQQILGWQPTTTLEEGLRQTVDFFRQQAQACNRPRFLKAHIRALGQRVKIT